MKRKNFLAGVVLTLIGGLGMVNIASATATVTPVEGEIVTYTLNSGFDTFQVFTAGVLEISGDDTKIYILDRNLGATAAGTGCDNDNNGSCYGGDLDPTYGYHFQRGNNYGFKPCSDVDGCLEFPNNETLDQTRVNSALVIYNPFIKKYYSNNVFIYGSENSNRVNEDLRDLRGVNFQTSWMPKYSEDMQGPCPEGYHVPSESELSKMISMLDNDLYRLHNDLLIPYAGRRYYSNGKVRGLGKFGLLRSSTPDGNGKAKRWRLGIDQENEIDGYGRGYGYSIRCFRNYDYEKPRVAYYTDSNISYVLNSGFETEQLFTGIGTITVSDGIDIITILDRNLGATQSGTGCIFGFNGNDYCVGGDLDPTYGYHFQRGNNYGFKPCSDYQSCRTFPNNETTGGQITTSIQYNPFYIDSIFRIGESNWLSDNDVVNLWGGNRSDYIDEIDGDNWKVTNATERQGPCPENFHVPSYGELLKLRDMIKTPREMVNSLYIPLAGGRSYDEWDGTYALGLTALLWSSSPAPDTDPRSIVSAMPLIFSTYNTSYDQFSYYNDNYGYERAGALSIRCVYNLYKEYPKLLNFWNENNYDQGSGIVCSGNVFIGDTIAGNLLNCVNGLSKDYYSLSGWLVSGENNTWFNIGDVVTENMDLIAVWTPNTDENENGIADEYEPHFTVTYRDGVDGEVIFMDQEIQNILSGIVTPEFNGELSRNGYTFNGWDPELENIVLSNMIYTAQWTKNEATSHGGGGSTIIKDNCPDGDYSDSYYDGICGTKPQDSSSQAPHNDKDISQNNEMQAAYEFAYENKITTMDTIEKADMDGGLNRIAMAKMLSQYAVNILKKTPDINKKCEFSDVTAKLDEEYNNGVTLACQLGIMGVGITDFRPFDDVVRSEFGTALSRLLFGIADGEDVYYLTHLAKLKSEGIITNDDPTLKELRGYVMLMLMRSAK